MLKSEQKGETDWDCNLFTEQEATSYLENNNNYFKLSSFRKNYIKIPYGKNSYIIGYIT